MLCSNNYSVQNDESLRRHGTNERTVRKRNKKVRRDVHFRRQQKTERERGAAVTCDGRLFHRRAASTGNALSPTVDRRVRLTSRDIDEAECTSSSGFSVCYSILMIICYFTTDQCTINLSIFLKLQKETSNYDTFAQLQQFQKVPKCPPLVTEKKTGYGY